MPDKFLPLTPTQGVRQNLGFERLNVIPDRRFLNAPLPAGRLPLILVSDNNSDAAAVTQFIVLAVTLEEVGN